MMALDIFLTGTRELIRQRNVDNAASELNKFPVCICNTYSCRDRMADHQEKCWSLELELEVSSFKAYCYSCASKTLLMTVPFKWLEILCAHMNMCKPFVETFVLVSHIRKQPIVLLQGSVKQSVWHLWGTLFSTEKRQPVCYGKT